MAQTGKGSKSKWFVQLSCSTLTSNSKSLEKWECAPCHTGGLRQMLENGALVCFCPTICIMCKGYQGQGREWSTPGVGEKGVALSVADFKRTIKLAKTRPAFPHHRTLAILESITDKRAPHQGRPLAPPLMPQREALCFSSPIPCL